MKGELTSTSQMPALKVMSGDIDDMMASLGRWACKRTFGEVSRAELDVGEDQAESCPLEGLMSARRQGYSADTEARAAGASKAQLNSKAGALFQCKIGTVQHSRHQTSTGVSCSNRAFQFLAKRSAPG